MNIGNYSLDASADPAITAGVKEQVGQSNQGLANSYSAPAISAGRGLLNAHDNFNSGLSFGDNATSAAIKSRYDQKYKQSENALKLDTMKNANADHIRNLHVATAAAGQEVELNKQKAILKWKIEQAEKKARGAVVGNVLGIVGGVVGAVYGGPAGAGAGYALGQGVGTAAGES